MARRRRSRRSLRPVWSMFLFGLFITLGFSPQSIVFEVLVDQIAPYVTYAAIIVLIVLVYFVYDSIYLPLRDLFHGFKRNGVLGLISLLMALVGGIFILVNISGIVWLLMAIGCWKLSVRFR